MSYRVIDHVADDSVAHGRTPRSENNYASLQLLCPVQHQAMYDDKLSVIKNVRNFGSVRKKEGLRLIGDENIQSHLTGVVNAGCSVFNSHAAIPTQQPAPHVRRATESSREDYIRLEHMSAMIPESFPEDNTQFPHLGVLSVSV